MSVINILMQLRKVCNHPDLFDPRPIVSPFQTDGIVYRAASLTATVLEYDPFKVHGQAGSYVLNLLIFSFS